MKTTWTSDTVSLTVVLSLITLVTAATSRTGSTNTFRAAVYEFSPVVQTNPAIRLSRKEAMNIMEKNIALMDEQARIAYRNSTDIIVFPENALYGNDITRETIKPYLEVVPDPEWERKPWSPCVEPNRYINKGEDTEALRQLSCIAWDYEMYVVVNMGSKVKCDALTDPYCPTDGQYQYNTNVVFDENGFILARYRKYYLYWQRQFNRPPRQEVITFKTRFGMFGTFASGDIFYKRPANDLVHRCKVKTIVVPMTWDNTFPFPLAIEVQQGFAISMGVNLVVANILEPRFKIGGSGIYSSNGAIGYRYNRHSYKGKLIMADLPLEPEKQPPLSKNLRQETNAKQTILYRTVSGNKMVFTPLIKISGTMKICHEGFCCNLIYKIDRTRGFEDTFVLGVFNGRHTKFIDLEIQVCGLIKCAGKGAKSCGRRTFTSHTTFTFFTIWGTFENPETVFPFVLLNGMSLGANAFNYSSGMIHSLDGFPRPVIDVILFGRNFADDPTLVPRPVNRTLRPTNPRTSSTRAPRTTTTDEKPNGNQPRVNGEDTKNNAAVFALWTTEFVLSLTGINMYLNYEGRKR